MKTKIQLFQACLVASCFLISPQLRATPLNLTAGPPDFIASSLSVNYGIGSNQFSAGGLTTAYLGGSAPLLGSGSYSLTGFINPSGVLVLGFLTICGDIGA